MRQVRVAVPKTTCPITRAGSNGRCNTIWYKAVFKGGVYRNKGGSLGFRRSRNFDVWRRWKAGQTLHEIGRAFGKEHSSIRCLVSRHGGIAPAVQRRALLALTLRGARGNLPRAGFWLRRSGEIAKCLERRVSTVSREVASSWWPSWVSSQSSGRRSLLDRPCGPSTAFFLST